MDSFIFNYKMEEEASAFTAASNNSSINITEPTKTNDNNFTSSHVGLLSATAPPFCGKSVNELIGIQSQQEAMSSDSASSNIDVDEILYNIRMNSSDLHVDNEPNPNHYYAGSSSQAESMVSSQIWSDNASAGAKSNEMTDTFDFLIKSISSANNYVSMLTREQLTVLRSIRPSLLYDFLQDVARVRSERRMRRALPNECAFCKNNGENEECYASHALKDFRGRVLCPVLRAFHCPRCGATGDRAHTIKYCPEILETDRCGGSRRRLTPPSALAVGAATNRTNYNPLTPTTPASSPIPSYSQSCWTAFSLK